jgi:streptogramin lyase
MTNGISATSTSLENPMAIWADSTGVLYFSGSFNTIQRISVEGIMDQFIGVYGQSAFNGDNLTPSSTQVNTPVGIWGDAFGNLYFTEYFGNRVRKYDFTGGELMRVIAGSIEDIGGYSGDGGPASSALLKQPTSIFVHSSGYYIYVADYNNNLIRFIDQSKGIFISTVSGASGLAGPYSTWLDSIGDLFIAEYGNALLRKLTSGELTTYAGTGTNQYSGIEDVPATLASIPTPITVVGDTNGNIYIGNEANRIQVIDSLGIISTLFGNGEPGISTDPRGSSVDSTYGIFPDSVGNIYYVSYASCLIRKASFITADAITVPTPTPTKAPTAGPTSGKNCIRCFNSAYNFVS